ncbi:hypothetical protein HPB48_019122 [Haemaphysalis longicornis]|uniref:Uncharacterized protein n=1 Tax=Haemaphysalis longicornis TaxID=44386 RepID=A0A9J6GBN9_HAELO|nr:hypothetical protein HPB48_019122 [Haemaphysalis longicornis]
MTVHLALYSVSLVDSLNSSAPRNQPPLFTKQNNVAVYRLPSLLKQAAYVSKCNEFVLASFAKQAGAMNISGGPDAADYAPHLVELDMPRGATHFVELYLKVVRRDHELRMRKPPMLEQRELLRMESRAELAYSPLLHALVVPTTYQRAPYLYATTRVPTYFNYGTLGALIGTGIADVIAPPATISTPKMVDGETPAGTAWWTEKALVRYNTSAACLQHLHTRLELPRPWGRRLALHGRAMFLRALGLRLAYDGLLASLGPQMDNDEFRKLWPEAQAEFFARFCLLSCDADQLPDPVLTPRASCLLPLHNMREFGATFDCSAREDFVTARCPL